jgi:hypothetical protein
VHSDLIAVAGLRLTLGESLARLRGGHHVHGRQVPQDWWAG